jgi:aldehyde:ferredoxin oxidoreductase
MTDFQPQGGYMGKILRVDLSSGQIGVERPDPVLISEYIGGSGLGMRILYAENKPGIDPFSPDNRIVFSTGPLTGTLIPGSGTYSVVSRNTLTGFAAACHSNGFFGARLKHAGFDAVIVQGCAEKPVYLHINDGKALLKDASDLTGMGALATERKLKKRYGEDGIDLRVSVAAIGPAGENLVRFACIVSDFGHVAATGGLGAIMGSKKLKAIVVHGNRPVFVGSDKTEHFLDLVRRWRTDALNSGMGKIIGQFGSIGLFSNYHKRGWVPVKNLTTNLFPGEEKFEAQYIRNEIYKSVPRACFCCTYNHCHSVQVKKGPYKGVVGEEVEYEILAGFGPNWGIYDPGAVTMLNTLNDDLGMDAKEASFLLSMMMEGYEKGFIDRQALDGIDLKWGDPESAAAALRAISRRQGIGDVLAEGVMRTAHTLGGDFPEIAVYVKKGNAPHIHDSRTRWGTLFNQIVSDMGSQEGLDLTVKGSPDLGIDNPTSEPDEYLGRVNARTEWMRQFEECLTYCYFQTPSFDTMIETVNCLTGRDLDREGALSIGRRIVNLMRMFNLREGMTAEHDSFSPRLGSAPVDGPSAGKSLAPNFTKVLQAYYEASGWDPKGQPAPELLESLNLGFTIKDLDR